MIYSNGYIHCSLLDQLLDINQVLLRHLFNVLHYVSLHMDENNMNSYNLSICVAPSMLWSLANAGPVTQVCDNPPSVARHKSFAFLTATYLIK